MAQRLSFFLPRATTPCEADIGTGTPGPRTHPQPCAMYVGPQGYGICMYNLSGALDHRYMYSL